MMMVNTNNTSKGINAKVKKKKKKEKLRETKCKIRKFSGKNSI